MRKTVAAGALLVVVAGCKVVPESVSNPRRELVVRFRVGVDTTGPEAQAVRDACPGGPHVVLEPASKSNLASERLTPVRYDIRGASDNEYGATLDCLGHQSAVYSSGISVGQ